MKQKGQFVLFNKEEFKEWIDKITVKREIKLIQNHHTYLPDYKSFKNNHFTLLENMKAYHVNSAGMRDIAQNITTFPDGTIAVCRQLDTVPAGIKGRNTGAICIEHLGNFDSDIMTEEHKETIIFVNAVICIRFNLKPTTTTIVYHHWFDLNSGEFVANNGYRNTKTCPGTKFFGGNTVEAANKNFIPLIIKEMEEMKFMTVFKDLVKNGKKHWAADLIEKAAEIGIVKGIEQEDRSVIFNPDAPITRAEAVALIMRAIEYVKN
jgi:hypothetical protein